MGLRIRFEGNHTLAWSDLFFVTSGRWDETFASGIFPVGKRGHASSRRKIVRTRPQSGASRYPLRPLIFRTLALFLTLYAASASGLPGPNTWVPIRWTGGPLELDWRARMKKLPADAVVRDAIARWYEPETLSLLEGSSPNCLLVTWSAGGAASVEAEQKRLVTAYAEAAHKRGLAVLGLIYAAGDASKIVADAKRAALDGVVLEGEFTPDFTAALRKAASQILVIEIAKDISAWRWKSAPIVALAGVAPSGHNLSEMGIRGAPSSQPWIESNIWLARSFHSATDSRSIWISSQLENVAEIDYERAVADAFAGGGRWIVSLDDALRSKLRARDPSAVEIWRKVSNYLKFAEAHAAWLALTTFGNVGIVVDASTEPDLSNEYLNLTTRRQVPYQLVKRSELNTAALAKFRALLAVELDPPSDPERKILHEFAESGGYLLVGPSWGDPPETERSAEIPTGRGTVVVYKDPDPETIAHDLKEVLSDDDLGVVPFNVPSIITSVSGGTSGQPLVIQLLNYFDHPVEAITLRVSGKFHAARVETPESAVLELPLRESEGKTEITIPKLSLWAAVSIE